jgi:hypothetical protein
MVSLKKGSDSITINASKLVFRPRYDPNVGRKVFEKQTSDADRDAGSWYGSNFRSSVGLVVLMRYMHHEGGAAFDVNWVDWNEVDACYSILS